MFLKDCWYVAAWSSEIGDAPVARTLLDEPVVLYRTADGAAVALADRCCHRALPLSMGTVVGNRLQCGYHGLEFAPDGQCVAVPGQSRIPPGAVVRSYPLVERAGWVWVWMGDPTRADERLLPDWWWMDHPEWKTVPGNHATPLYTRCNYLTIIENLLDLSHLSFVHADSIGNDVITRFPCRTERLADGVRMTRIMPEVEPAAFYTTVGGFTGAVDRWQIVDARLPVYVDVDVGCAEIGRGALDGNRNQGIAFHVPNCPTPETATTTHHFYAHSRLFQIDSAVMDEVYRTDFLRVFHQDLAIMEAQQRMVDEMPDAPVIDINVDAPALRMRELLNNRIAAQSKGEDARADVA